MQKIYEGKFLMTGNVISDQQRSNYIRCKKHTLTPLNQVVPEGQLMEYDLKQLPAYYGFFRNTIRRYAETSQDKHIIAYCIRHYTGPSYDRRPVVKGYILTKAYPDYSILYVHVEPSPNAMQIIDSAIEQIKAEAARLKQKGIAA